ncbi:hypothetical protein DXG01_005386 [Tephrocybe rancida]|nr:hypothetical protein DXG01_005386 [Tephrocybe rancida]
MPSFRTAFLFAATAFAAFASAAPIAGGANPLTGALGTNNPITDKVQNVNVQGIQAAKRTTPVGGDLGATLEKATGALTPTKTRRDDLQTLPQILVAAQAQLTVVAGSLSMFSSTSVDRLTYANPFCSDDAKAGKSTVDTQILVDIVGQVQIILCGALDAVKLLVGSPIDFILTLDGKVLALVDVCHLLVAVVSIVCTILACILHLVASASVSVVAPLIAGVGAVLVDLLHCIFDLVPGLVANLGPFLGPVVSLLVSLKLDIVVEALHGKL